MSAAFSVKAKKEHILSDQKKPSLNFFRDTILTNVKINENVFMKGTCRSGPHDIRLGRLHDEVGKAESGSTVYDCAFQKCIFNVRVTKALTERKGKREYRILNGRHSATSVGIVKLSNCINFGTYCT